MSPILALRSFRAVSTLLLLLFASAATPWGRELSSDEHVLLLPQPARWVEGGLELHVEAMVYELERRPGVHSAFAHYLGIDSDQLSAKQVALFRQRTQLFRIDAERGKQPLIRLPGGAQFRLRSSNANGRSSTTVVLPWDETAGEWLPLSVQVPSAHPRSYTARAQLLEASGWSVISDIDDTIKHSNVRDRRELLLNTFTRPFVAVPGVASVYRRWASGGASFHYVSSSPVQLLPPLRDFVDQARFPDGSLHLRTLDLLEELWASGDQSRAHKLHQIKELLRRFEHRRFILVGDSGEADPEIYAHVLQQHPEQIQQILIRDVSGEPQQAPRYAQLLPAELAQRLLVFQDASELPHELRRAD
jgi:phosphatidate phosphatase APP1